MLTLEDMGSGPKRLYRALVAKESFLPWPIVTKSGSKSLEESINMWLHISRRKYELILNP